MRYASGIVARSAALPRSPAIRIGRRGRRSTHTPAGSVNRMNGRNSTVPSAATWKADASSTRTAASGSASWETCVPNWLTVSADHSLRKSAWRQRPPVGHIRLAISTPGKDERGGLEERKYECLNSANLRRWFPCMAAVAPYPQPGRGGNRDGGTPRIMNRPMPNTGPHDTYRDRGCAVAGSSFGLWTCSGLRRRERESSTPSRLSSRPRGSRWHA